MSELHQDVLNLIREGQLPNSFTTRRVKELLSGRWKVSTLSTFFSKHRVGNSGNYTAYYRKVQGGYCINE